MDAGLNGLLSPPERAEGAGQGAELLELLREGEGGVLVGPDSKYLVLHNEYCTLLYRSVAR